MKFSGITEFSSAIIGVVAIFVFYGFVYEQSYFMALGLSANKILGIRHYVYSGFIVLIPPLIILSIFGSAIKFFSNRIEKNEYEEFAIAVEKIGFRKSIDMARMTFLVCLILWGLAVFGDKLFIQPYMWATMPWMGIFILGSFIPAFFSGQTYSKPTVLVFFIISVALCVSICRRWRF